MLGVDHRPRNEMGRSKPCRLIEISGPPYERGRQYGEQAAPEIRRGIAHYESQVRNFQLSDPDLARIVAMYLPTIETFEPRFIDEMRGIAQGADVEFHQIVMLNARTEVLKLAADPDLLREFRSVVADGCTSIVVEPEAAAESQLIHAHNWDWKVESADASVVLRIRCDDGPDILTFTEAGALGRFGFNSSGIAITANYLESDRDYMQVGVPLAVIRRKVLEQTHLAPAIRTVCATPKSGSNNIAVSHSGGGMVFDFECAPDEAFEVEPQAGVLVHANHWRSPAALVKLRDEGVKSTPDSLCRERRARKLLAGKVGRLTVDDVKTVLLDDWQTPWSICRPPRPASGTNISATVITLVMQPSLGIMEIAVLPTVDPTFSTYTLDVRSVAKQASAKA
jgi:isopenicillin-N N-acyltransferase like protein